MITIIVVKNPFAPYKGREIHKIKYKPDKTLLDYTKPYLFDNIDADNMIFAVKGKLVNPDNKINDGDFIVMSPSIGKGGGKNPLLVVATIALSVAAMSLGAGFAGVSALSQATGWAAIGGYAVAAGVMYLGGTLINHAFGTAKKESASNPTYSWDGITTTSGQGNPIPLTYGTVKSGGQTLSKFITISNDNQYLYWLISAGEGPLSFSDIEMNSNPIGYYKDTSYDIRNGTFNQSAIANFNDTVSTLALDQELLTDSYRQYNIDGNANQGLMIQVECSNGLYYANDNGSLGTEWVSIKADYCITGSNNWITFVNESISAAQTSAVRKQYRVDGIAAGTYTVRVICTGRGADIGSTRAQTRIWWTAVSGITYDDFCYPGIGLIGIKVLATDQLSGSPAVTFLKTRSTVLVYNPDKAVYEQQDATNPAWASYDAVHRAVDLYGDGSAVVIDGAPAELMMYDKFAAWAASCTAKNLHVNIEVNTADEMLTVINKNIACVGYGRVQLFGVKYGCTFDDVVDTPVQMFTMGNIIQGSFQEEFLQTSDRANAVEITFTNKDKNYERDTTTVYSDDYDEADQYNTVTSITMDGITSYEQAYAYGKYQLYCNKWLVRTCIFNASIDAIACNVGDVVALSHDVPEWACSGRITAVNGNTITMNGIFDNYDSAVAYQFQYRASDTDSLYTVEVSSITILSDGAQAVLASLGTDAPSIGDICDIAKVNIGSKWFTIKAITRSNNGEFERQITALEYNANVFSQNYTVPPQNYSTAQANQAQNVINISARQVHWLASDGTKHAHLYASWELPSGAYASKFLVYASTDNVNFNMIAEVSAFSIDFDTLPDTIYYLKIKTIIKTITASAQSSGVTITVDAGQDTPPHDIKTFDVVQSGDNLVAIITEVSDPDLNHYEIRLGTAWEKSSLIGTFIGNKYIFAAADEGTLTYFVKAVDNSGNYSLNAAKSICNVTNLPERNVVFTENVPQGQWIIQSMWQGIDGYYRIAGKKVLRDYDKFTDIFAQPYALKDDAQILLPVIDLGMNMIDASCLWTDSAGKMHIRYTKKLSDFDKFTDIFNAQLEYMKVQYRNSTFVSVDVDGYALGNAKYTVEYRTSIDNITYSEWVPESIKQFAGRYIQIRITPQSIDGVGNMFVKAVSVTIDVPDITEIQENIAISAGTVKTVPFLHTFEQIKSISAYTEDSNGKQATCELTNKTMTSVDVAILDDADTRISGILQKLEIRGF